VMWEFIAFAAHRAACAQFICSIFFPDYADMF